MITICFAFGIQQFKQVHLCYSTIVFLAKKQEPTAKLVIPYFSDFTLKFMASQQAAYFFA